MPHIVPKEVVVERKSLVRMLAARFTPATARWVGDASGLGCLVAAAWCWHAGLAALGVAVLLLVARADQ